MKVLRPGRQPAEWSREVTCTGKGGQSEGKGCQALLSINRDDLFKTCGGATLLGASWFVTIKCPECGALTDLGPLKEWSPKITANLMPRLAWEAKQIGQVEKAAQQAAEGMVTNGSPKLPSSDYVPTVVGRAGMYCRDCGTPEHIGNVFCPRCGAE